MNAIDAFEAYLAGHVIEYGRYEIEGIEWYPIDDYSPLFVFKEKHFRIIKEFQDRT